MSLLTLSLIGKNLVWLYYCMILKILETDVTEIMDSRFAKKRNVKVIRNLCGHGIGSFFHGPPDIYHCLNDYPGTMLPGMIFTLEPCITEGSNKIQFWPDGFTVSTVDGSRTAQFEHTILITDSGVEILSA